MRVTKDPPPPLLLLCNCSTEISGHAANHNDMQYTDQPALHNLYPKKYEFFVINERFITESNLSSSYNSLNIPLVKVRHRVNTSSKVLIPVWFNPAND